MVLNVKLQSKSFFLSVMATMQSFFGIGQISMRCAHRHDGRWSIPTLPCQDVKKGRQGLRRAIPDVDLPDSGKGHT